MRYSLLVLLPILALTALWAIHLQRAAADGPTASTLPAMKDADPKNLKQATFAAGCFWGVEAAFRKLPGVVETQVGYTGGHTDNPTYAQVCTDLTGHAEAVLVTYDSTKISYAELLDAFWTSHDPTTVDSQGPDFGTQYRSAIFFHDADQEKAAKDSLKEVTDSKAFHDPIVTQIVKAGTFTKAEDYHQQYFEKNGGTCHVGPATVHTKLAADAAKARETK
jgi:peptide-methionine (S)-S-oxide reductase